MRVFLYEDATDNWAKNYCWKTTRWSNFDHWRNDGTDLYMLLHAFKGFDHEEGWSGYGLNHRRIYTWLRASSQGMNRESEVIQLFLNLDNDLKIHDDSLKAIRRLAMHWPRIDADKKRVLLTRMVQLFKYEMPRSELLTHLLSLKSGVRDLDEADLVENATSGSTAAGSVATIAGGLGAGFDNDYSKSIYPAPKAQKKPLVIRRNQK